MERIFDPASSGWEEMGGVSGADPTTDGSGIVTSRQGRSPDLGYVDFRMTKH
jgi:hypothetical protein